MNLHKTTALCVIAAAVTLPGISFAASEWHPTGGEEGGTYHPNHATSAKTRAAVTAELDAARKDGTLAIMHRGGAVPVKSTGPGKTRDQVVKEMRNESPEARRARMQLYAGG
ncbi:DUF4148 domain-containing protein [uncultured Aquimonas sp.]|uniref:DUF4148 domain-containing protein n=1 Tax=uncultured Aquimonas sp. TaxID=385483 RepID=UPI0026181633|nr:DUF4148 domain-containing protein [uncultured Aquimonas sp.]